MDVSGISLTVTEKYLENLQKRILRDVERTSQEHLKSRLQSLLVEVQKRIKPRKRPENEQVRKEPSPIFDAANLDKEEYEAVKGRLKGVLEEIKSQRPESRQNESDPSLTLNYQEETDGVSHTVLDAKNLTQDEYAIVKDRMRDMISDVEKRKLAFQRAQQRLQQQLEQKIQDETEQKLRQQIQQQIEGGIIGDFQRDDQEEGEIISLDDQEAGGIILLDDQEELDPASFAGVCQKVSQGETPVLFNNLELTDREQKIVEAFEEHLKQLKGLKRQQAFDLQHLTARSIREFEQVFKSYQPQGYLNVELHNIYNRLLALRSRFSVLLH